MEMNDKLLLDEQIDELQMRYLTFRSNNQLYGLPITEIVQITQMQEIVPLPEQANYIKGIIIIRGQVIPLIDIRLRFGLQEADITERTCIIVIRVNNSEFGLIVDEVNEVFTLRLDQISKPPMRSTNLSSSDDYLTGIAQISINDSNNTQVILLLQPEKILKEYELSSLSQTAENI